MAKSTKKNTSTPPIKTQFNRWLLPAVLTITFYLISALLAALYAKEKAELGNDVEMLIAVLFTFSLAAAVWWLIESARWIIMHIDTRTARTITASKKASKKKK
jgi:hypothetical protein